MPALFDKPSFWILSALFLFTVNLPASTVTFAQFQEAGAGGNDFTFINSGSSAVFQTKNPKTGATSVPVTFSFLGFAMDQLPSDLQGPQSAQMRFYIKTTQKVATFGNFFDQDLYSVNSSGLPNYGTVTFTRTTPDGEIHQTNLLTVSFYAIAGGLDGIRKGETATLSADNEANLGPGQVDYVQFSSSYINFAASSDENLALSFSSANPCFSTYKNVKAGIHGCVTTGSALLSFLHSFTAAGTGTFASDPPPVSVFAVPEPESLSFMLFGLPFIVARYLQRRTARETRLKIESEAKPT